MGSETFVQFYPRKEARKGGDFIPKVVKAGREKIKNGFSAVFVVDGDVGMGKTSFGVLLGDEFHGSEIDLKKQLALGGEDFQKKLLPTNKRGDHVLIYDEAGDFNRRGALTKFNRDMLRLFEVSRQLEILVIIVLPRFYVLDKQFFELNQIRGVFHISHRVKNRATWTAYTTTQAMYIRAWAQKLTVPQTCYKFGHTIARGIFYNLPEERAKTLAKVSLDSKTDTLSQLFKQKDLLTLKEICENYGRTSRWVRNILSQIDPGTVETIGKKKYYEKSIITKIDSFIESEG